MVDQVAHQHSHSPRVTNSITLMVPPERYVSDITLIRTDTTLARSRSREVPCHPHALALISRINSRSGGLWVVLHGPAVVVECSSAEGLGARNWLGTGVEVKNSAISFAHSLLQQCITSTIANLNMTLALL